MPAKPYALFFEEAKRVVNGQVVQDRAVKTEYDGKVLHVDRRDQNQAEHFDIKDKQLKKLLAQPTSLVGLSRRLKRDFKRTRRRSGHKRSGHKRSGHKHKRNKHSGSKRKKRSGRN
jgi:hypothetical protein